MPGDYRVIILPEAFTDLDGIVDYIAEDSPKNAANIIDRLQRAAKSLGQLPQRYQAYRWNKYPERIIRSMPVPPYVIYYRVIEQPPTVRVLKTIRHSARRRPRDSSP
jgi:plasmid stabilization system protein ParE